MPLAAEHRWRNDAEANATPCLAAVLAGVVLAGLFAGGVLAAFHWTLTEPVIERTLVLEQARQAGSNAGPAVVSREVQRVGLWAGFLLYGLFVGILCGGAYWFTPAPGWKHGAVRKAIGLAMLAWWGTALLPFLKYPANPPGVGESATIALRQQLYLGFLVLSLCGMLAAVAARSRLRARPLTATWADFLVLASYGGYAGLLFALFPGNPDPVTLPVELITTFRLLALAGLTLFWLTFGVVLSFLIPRQSGSLA